MLLYKILGVLCPYIGYFRETSDLCTGVADQFVGMASTHFPWSNNRNIDSAVGRGITLGRPDMGRQNKRSGGERCLFKEGSSICHRLGWCFRNIFSVNNN
ncbi:MAG: hypothetical protein VX153_02575 [Verrucomicrobiota bacterium]|nr:hypothetical protein [Verrucomicrobiota bacterium]